MENENYKLKFLVEDWDGVTSYSHTYNGHAPTVKQFGQFCYEAGISYGFTPLQLNQALRIYDLWEI